MSETLLRVGESCREANSYNWDCHSKSLGSSPTSLTVCSAPSLCLSKESGLLAFWFGAVSLSLAFNPQPWLYFELSQGLTAVCTWPTTITLLRCRQVVIHLTDFTKGKVICLFTGTHEALCTRSYPHLPHSCSHAIVSASLLMFCTDLSIHQPMR